MLASHPQLVCAISKDMASRESIPAPLRLRLSGPTAVHDAVVAAGDFAKRAGLDGANSSRLAIVVEELVINLYDHGDLQPDDGFELALSSDGTELRFALTARGQEFDPWAPVPQRQSSAAGAGAGLKLAKAWSSRFEHEYAGGHNRLALTLPIQA
jgi:anti-sigma regulatory factor (Ser/Thr protein kinase)